MLRLPEIVLDQARTCVNISTCIGHYVLLEDCEEMGCDEQLIGHFHPTMVHFAFVRFWTEAFGAAEGF